MKWNDRLTDDGRWEPNLYNFATLAMRKLLFTLPSEGRLHGVQRKDGGELHEAIREAIINTISYCDYKLNGVLRIDRRTDEIIFRNPGTLRISRERIYDGDFTHARNRTIQRMFRMVGYGDNIGSGFQKILAAWRTLSLPTPDLREQPDVQEVWLTLYLNSNQNSTVKSTAESPESKECSTSNESLSTVNSTVNSTEEALDKIKSDTRFSEIQKHILSLMVQSPAITISQIALNLNKDRNAINYQLKKLKGIITIEREGSDKTGIWKISL